MNSDTAFRDTPYCGVTICSLDELQVPLSEEVRSHLASAYLGLYGNDDTKAFAHLDRVLNAMKTSPATTICRVNQILATRNDVMEGLRQQFTDTDLTVSEHELFHDVVCVDDSTFNPSQSLSGSRIPPSENYSTNQGILSNWPSRANVGWPTTHRVLLCDRFCGAAVLRGSDIFVVGVLAADVGIRSGENVAIYAHIRSPEQSAAITRGLALKNYAAGTCVFLGIGKTVCSRSDMFRLDQGVAVRMSTNSDERVGPVMPPLHGVLAREMMLQNLPSIVAGYALNPQPGETILDMCAAPGGKSTHLASLVRNQATIVSCDRSRKKVVSVRELVDRVGATCITSLALDTTDCVERREDTDEKSVQEV
jgi:hypothetical protein